MKCSIARHTVRKRDSRNGADTAGVLAAALAGDFVGFVFFSLRDDDDDDDDDPRALMLLCSSFSTPSSSPPSSSDPIS